MKTKNSEQLFPKPLKCKCLNCNYEWTKTFDTLKVILPHKPAPITCPKCGTWDNLAYDDIDS